MTEPKKSSVRECYAALTIAVEEAIANVEGIDPNSINTLLKAFREIATFKEDLESLLKVVNHMHTKLASETIPDSFETNEIDSVKVGGYNFILGTRMYASIPEAKKEEGFAWLREHGLDALIKPNVNPQSLTSAVKSYVEEHGEMPPDTAITTHMKRNISVRKA